MQRPARRAGPEVLAPAGDLDCAFAAFEHGADAVYFGLRRFSARAEAANLSEEEAGELAAYAHGLPAPRRVYATVNTLVQQHELSDLVENLATLAEIGADAIIVQDLGAARVARRLFPSLRLHASTQMAVQSAAGARALRDLGFSRVTLARELSLPEIRAIAAAGGIEVEVFVHGALCYCTSGLCLYSSHLRGRSGNRGRCAYPCRDLFRSAGSPATHPFSMMDLCRADRVADLAGTGVASLKIEGRMKGPLYTACLSRLYRGAADGTLSRAERDALAEDARTIFSRPWTDLYLDGPAHRGAVDPATVGHRGARIGAVAAVTGGDRRPRGRAAPAARRLRLTTSRPLERHDGLQVDLPDRDVPYGFAVDDLWVVHADGTPRAGFEAAAGATVEVGLPPDAPAIPAGAPVYCASSQAVKRTYTFTRPRPGTWAFRRPMHVAITVRPDGLRWDASVELLLPPPASAPASSPPPPPPPDTAPPPCPREPAAEARAAGEMAGRFEPARDAEAVATAARQAFGKLGHTRLRLAGLRVDNPGGLFVPVSALNAVRREAAAAVEPAADRQRAAWVARACERVLRDAPDGTAACECGEAWTLKTDQPECLQGFSPEDRDAADEVTVELTDDTLATLTAWVRGEAPPPARRLRIALPAIARPGEEEPLAAAVRRWVNAGWARWEVASLAGWAILREAGAPGVAGFDLTADWPLYALNAPAAALLAEMGASGVTLSPEDDLANWRGIAAVVARRATVPVYQDTPLFVSETCARAEGCARCAPETCVRREEAMTSASGEHVVSIVHRCRTTVINERPFCLGGMLGELRAAGFRRFRVDLLHRAYSAGHARDVWRAVRAGRAPGPAHAGNALRGLDAGAVR